MPYYLLPQRKNFELIPLHHIPYHIGLDSPLTNAARQGTNSHTTSKRHYTITNVRSSAPRNHFSATVSPLTVTVASPASDFESNSEPACSDLPSWDVPRDLSLLALSSHSGKAESEWESESPRLGLSSQNSGKASSPIRV